MKKSKELKPIDVSNWNVTESGQVLKYPKINTIDLFLKKIELELEDLRKEYDIREADFLNIKHSIGVIRNEASY